MRAAETVVRMAVAADHREVAANRRAVVAAAAVSGRPAARNNLAAEVEVVDNSVAEAVGQRPFPAAGCRVAATL